MKPKLLKIFFITFSVHLLFLAGLYTVHVLFSLPICVIEGVDVLAPPDEPFPISCLAELDFPGLKSNQQSGLTVRFRAQRGFDKSVKTDTAGWAKITIPAELISRSPVLVSSSLVSDAAFVYHNPNPLLGVFPVHKSTRLVLCDIGATLAAGTWNSLPKRKPGEWQADMEAIRALSLLSGSALQKVVYVAGGTTLLTTEVRSYLASNRSYDNITQGETMYRFPQGPILFPDAPPVSSTFASFLKSFHDKWPQIRAFVTKKPQHANTVLSLNIPVVFVGKAGSGKLSPHPKLSMVHSWKEVVNAVK